MSYYCVLAAESLTWRVYAKHGLNEASSGEVITKR